MILLLTYLHQALLLRTKSVLKDLHLHMLILQSTKCEYFSLIWSRGSRQRDTTFKIWKVKNLNYLIHRFRDWESQVKIVKIDCYAYERFIGLRVYHQFMSLTLVEF